MSDGNVLFSRAREQIFEYDRFTLLLYLCLYETLTDLSINLIHFLREENTVKLLF